MCLIRPVRIALHHVVIVIIIIELVLAKVAARVVARVESVTVATGGIVAEALHAKAIHWVVVVVVSVVD